MLVECGEHERSFGQEAHHTRSKRAQIPHGHGAPQLLAEDFQWELVECCNRGGSVRSIDADEKTQRGNGRPINKRRVKLKETEAPLETPDTWF